MEDVHEGLDHSTHIKLFGKTINVQVITEMKEDPPNRSEDDDDDQTLVNKRQDKIMACPRCKSMETKFCYFNNYNVNQPRHYCKGCHRYWTAGGALRNVPVGAGRRIKTPKSPFGHDLLGGSCSDVSFLDDTESSAGPGGNHVVGWQLAAQGCYQHLFQVKRRRNTTGDF